MTKYTLESSREWYNNLPGKRVSAAMIVRHEGKYLLIKDDYKQAMTFPSGVVDTDESAQHAAVRETKEETGLSSVNVQFYSVAYVSEHYGFNDMFHFFFVTDIDDAQINSLAFEEGIEYHKWVGAEEIGTLCGDRPVYNRVGDMLISGNTVPYFEV
jgi:8-oxo-dGTP pyrophosphatase MutT (NUDIX family)